MYNLPLFSWRAPGDYQFVHRDAVWSLGRRLPPPNVRDFSATLAKIQLQVIRNSEFAGL